MHLELLHAGHDADATAVVACLACDAGRRCSRRMAGDMSALHGLHSALPRLLSSGRGVWEARAMGQAGGGGGGPDGCHASERPHSSAPNAFPVALQAVEGKATSRLSASSKTPSILASWHLRPLSPSRVGEHHDMQLLHHPHLLAVSCEARGLPNVPPCFCSATLSGRSESTAKHRCSLGKAKDGTDARAPERGWCNSAQKRREAQDYQSRPGCVSMQVSTGSS